MNPQPKQVSGSIAVDEGVVKLNVLGLSSLAIQIAGTFTGTVQFEGTADGTNWAAINMTPPNSSTPVTSTTAPGLWIGNCGGLREVRARVSDYSDGTVEAQINAAIAGAGSSAGSGGGPSEDFLGFTGGKQVVVDVTPTLTTHASYVANDFVGTDGVAMVFDNVGRIANGSGIILSAVLMDKALQSVAAELWLFDSAITPPADSAAWSISDADMAHLIGVIPFSVYYASALNSVAPVNSIGIPFKCIGDDDKIYGCLVTRGAPAYADGDVSVRLTVLQD